jgi:hypothetical protein
MELIINELDDIPENQYLPSNSNSNSNSNKKISYEDILSKMNMFVSNGKLYLDADKNIGNPTNQNHNHNPNNNSYIYNKYFKNETIEEPTIRKPKTLQEYKLMLLKDYLQRQRIRQIKSTKLLIPTNNISMSNNANFDRLFHFPKR